MNKGKYTEIIEHPLLLVYLILSVLIRCLGLSCADFPCPHGKHCVMNDEGHPQCVCSTRCPNKDSPVCGSDKKTYDNDCELLREACQTNTNIILLHHGRCHEGKSAGSNRCDLHFDKCLCEFIS